MEVGLLARPAPFLAGPTVMTMKEVLSSSFPKDAPPNRQLSEAAIVFAFTVGPSQTIG